MPNKPRRTWLRSNLPTIDVSANIDSLVARGDSARLVILAGAGVSVDAPTSLPTARAFLAELYAHALPETLPRDTLLNPDFGPRFELVLDVLRRRFDPDLSVLHCFLNATPNQNHRCLAALARQGATVVTTNFDVMIERALAETGEVHCAYSPQHFGDSSTGRSNATPTVWHLHGVIEDPATSELQPQSVIASIQDVLKTRHFFRIDAAKGAFLQRVLRERDLVVIGYSGADDYDIVPFLVSTQCERELTWLHHLNDPSELTRPSTVEVFEGDVWYREESMNLLAQLLENATRPSKTVRALRCNTAHALQLLADGGYRQTSRQLSREGIPGSSTERHQGTSSGAPDRSSWEQGLLTWAGRRFPVAASKYHFANELCLAAGLGATGRKLTGAMRAEPKMAAERQDISWSIAAYIDATMHSSPLQSNYVIPDLQNIARAVHLELSEVYYNAAKKEVSQMRGSGELGYAIRYCLDALREAEVEQNPRMVARTNLLVARIAELDNADDASVVELYERAVHAAYDSGSHEVLALAYARMGLFRWKRLKRGNATLEEFWGCVATLAEAFRLQLVQEDSAVLEQVAASLGLALDSQNSHRPRGLRAHAHCLLASINTGNRDIQAGAEQRIKNIAKARCPIRGLDDLHGERLATQVLARLDTVSGSDI